MRIFYFNPYNDLALAADTRHFTPPASALQVERAGAALPLWWASEDDVVLVPDEYSLAVAHRISTRYGLPDVAALEVGVADGAVLSPWGWSRHAVTLFARAGVRAEILPSDKWIDTHRLLSHRRTAISTLRLLGWPDHLLPLEARTVDEAMECYHTRGRAVMKLPWSGSGRGVMLAHEIPDSTLRGYVEGVIRRQGSIIVEPFYRRVMEFAMLFEVTDRIEYTGVSVFAADSRGRYTGNVVAPQSQLRSLIPTDTSGLEAAMEQALRPIANAGYHGPVGVDMMVYTDGTATAVMPCIEVNLRYTMGMVAARLAERGIRGLLRFSNSPGAQTVSGSGPCFNVE